MSLIGHGTAVTDELAARQAALGQQLVGDLDPDRLRDFLALTTLVAGRLERTARSENRDPSAVLDDRG